MPIYGKRRHHPIPDELRGPDSVECTPGLLGGQRELTHYDCILNYTSLGQYGFMCGCSCHDEEGLG
jgi:hypothetical protein